MLLSRFCLLGQPVHPCLFAATHQNTSPEFGSFVQLEVLRRGPNLTFHLATVLQLEPYLSIDASGNAPADHCLLRNDISRHFTLTPDDDAMGADGASNPPLDPDISLRHEVTINLHRRADDRKSPVLAGRIFR